MASPAMESNVVLEAPDPTLTLMRRLDSWKHAVTLLGNYIEGYRHLYKDQIKALERIAKSVAETPQFDATTAPDSNERWVADGNRTVNQVDIFGGFFQLRERSQALLNACTEAERAIASSINPSVERLIHDIKEHHKGLKLNGLKGAKEVDAARAATQKQIELLGQHTSGYHLYSAGNKPTVARDPFVTGRVVYNRLESQLQKESFQADSLVTIQKDFGTFESHVVQAIQQIMALLDQAQSKYVALQQESFAAIASTFAAIPPLHEWNEFQRLNAGILVDPAAPRRTVGDIVFPNMSHEALTPLIDGVLQRKGTMAFSKSYNAGYYVVSKAGFLHQYASKDHVQSPDPDFSVYLPDAVIGQMYSQESGKNKFKLTAKDATRTLATKHTYEFKTSTYDDLIRWWNIIYLVTGQADNAAAAAGDDDTAPPASPVSPASPASTFSRTPTMSSRAPTYEDPDVSAATTGVRDIHFRRAGTAGLE
ncbi:uncharacterized protein V1510DRAFT_411321 [Dipodascopsis tothii]|uniref:uncharacterized protein n=1 Tax=Dipodascopsis tothii TaxID=44089 RepID=UPI0034CFDA1C